MLQNQRGFILRRVASYSNGLSLAHPNTNGRHTINSARVLLPTMHTGELSSTDITCDNSSIKKATKTVVAESVPNQNNHSAVFNSLSVAPAVPC